MNFEMNRRRWIGLSLAGLAGAGALGALGAFVAAPALGGGGGLFGHGHGWGRHGHHQLSAEQIRGRVEWLLRGVDASEQQVESVTTIAADTLRELRDAHAQHRGARDQIVAALSGASVDRAALETLRAEHVAAADTASRQLTEAIAQIAEVLTPEQRSELALQHAKFHALHDAEE